jgi:hypothetical protein
MVGTVARPVFAGADRLGRPGEHGRVEGQVELFVFRIIVSCKKKLPSLLAGFLCKYLVNYEQSAQSGYGSDPDLFNSMRLPDPWIHKGKRKVVKNSFLKIRSFSFECGCVL